MSKSEVESRDLTWRKSSFSGMTNCVEVAVFGRSIALRDSKHPEQGYFIYSRGEWRSFVEGVRAGEFDDMADDMA